MQQLPHAQFLVAAFLAMIFFAGTATWWLLGRRMRGQQASVVRKRGFMTGNEREFFGRLTRALPEYFVFPQVSMGALLDVTVRPDHPRYWPCRDQFSRKICDFVICDRRTLEPACLVELDDRMHDFASDSSRDDVTTMAGLKTLRAWSRNKPSEAEIRKQVAELLAR